MLRNAESMQGITLQGTDGRLGEVEDLLFDDVNWVIRYLVAETGSWLAERQVLLSPLSVREADHEGRVLRMDLTAEQIEKSPSIERDLPVGRQHEAQLNDYYGWPMYWEWTWTAPMSDPFPTSIPNPDAGDPEDAPEEPPPGDPHLRSAGEVRGYRIEARDGSIGHVEDLVVDAEQWVIRYLIIDTRNWLPGRKVLFAPKWVEKIDWGQRRVHIAYDRQHVQNSPVYTSTDAIDRAHEEALHDHYDQPRYWTQEAGQQ